MRIDVKGVESNSRLIRKGYLFIAVRGFNEDGNRYIADAVRRGASVLITDKKPDIMPKVPVIIVPDSRKALSRIAANFYGHPSRKMKIVGITGTNGKTTISYLIEAILRGQGYRTGVIGTIRYKIGDEIIDAPNTTPDSLQLQRLLAGMVAKKTDWVVMEVSSHALELHRVDDCAFDHALFTNLTEDHFDFHKTFENYYLAKKKLFNLLKASPKNDKFAIVNVDDKYGARLMRDIKGIRFSGYSIKKSSAFKAENLSLGFNKTAFQVNRLQIDSTLSGQFNVYNILSVFAWASEAKLKKTLVVKSLDDFKAVEGRFELFSRSKGPKVIVDYAHTDDALKNVLHTINQIKTGRVITVFGCGGSRDKFKRPKMGRIADKLSDIVIVTSDNPRKEDPQAIINDIMKGIKRKRDLVVEVDRMSAIQKAFAIAKADDVILIAGKGHEDYQIFKDRTIHFSDREIAAKILKEKYR